MESVGAGDSVRCAIDFAGRPLGYALVVGTEFAEIGADFNGDGIDVRVPALIAAQWAGSGDVSLEGSAGAVSILVEKDFQCLHKSNAENADAFPNPRES